MKCLRFVKTKKPAVLALLGNICSGKSLAIDIFKKYGFFTFRADDIVSNEYLDLKSIFSNEIINLFRKNNINIVFNNKINKSKILESVISNEELYLEMNNITKKFIVPKIYSIVNTI